MDGRHEQWIEIERHRLGDLYFELVQVLMSHCAVTAQYGQGCEIGLASLRHDAARESTHRWMMRLQYLAGDRVAALRQYKCCQSMLRREFGAVPDLETRNLHDRILRAEPLVEGAEHAGAQNPSIEMVSDLRRKIVKMERDIDALQTQLAAYAPQPQKTA